MKTKMIMAAIQMSKSYNKEKNNPNWKGGISKIKPSCLECGIKLNNYKSKYCNKCFNKNDRNPLWKGSFVGLGSLHKWIKRYKPKPELCEKCKEFPPRDLANISGKYKRDVNDYKWLCRKCHMKEDGRIDKLRLNLKPRHKILIKSICLNCNKEYYTKPSVSKYTKFCCKNCKDKFRINKSWQELAFIRKEIKW